MGTLNPNVWGPHYWFFLHTIAMRYPIHPNSTTQKKYYELIQNFPLFIPDDNIAKDFIQCIEEKPIQAYLDTRDSFIAWVNYIHNRINVKLEKDEVSLEDFYVQYFNQYKENDIKLSEFAKWKEKILYIFILFCLCILILYFYNK